MGQSDAYALPHSELNGFLFADVGEEASGMKLSVLSTLARLGMDPWQEAARLARLPRKAAVDALARLIANLPNGLWSLPDATQIADRLVTLLPTAGGQAAAPPATPVGPAAMLAWVTAQVSGRDGGSASAAPAGVGSNRRWLIALALLGAVLAGVTLMNRTDQRAAGPDGAANAFQPATSKPMIPGEASAPSATPAPIGGQ